MHLFGPVLRYDLVCTARRARYFVMRFFYALLLFLVLYVFYVYRLGSVTVEKVAQKLLTDFAELFSYTYLMIQYLLVLIMTPAYVGSAIAEEKERRTLEFLLATDLRSQEIIFGKMASRLGNLLMFLLAGLPVLAFVLFFGGVDPELLKNGFIATLATLFSVTAVSIFCSVHAKHSRDGIIRSYFVVVGYFIFGFILSWIIMMLQGRFGGPTALTGTNWKLDSEDFTTRALCYFTEYYLTGDIFHAIYLYGINAAAPFLGTTSWTGINLGTSMGALLRNYLIFHISLAIFCLGYSIWRLRAIFVKQAYGESRRRVSQLQPVKVPVVAHGAGDSLPQSRQQVRMARGRRWRIGNWPPMVWKELLVPQLLRRTLIRRLFTGVIWAVYLFPLAMIIFFNSNASGVRWYDLAPSMNAYGRIAGSACICLMILAVGIRAANAICNERDKQTLETLLSTVITDRQIVLGKWIGCVFGFGPSIYLLTIIWITCLVTGGIVLESMLLQLLALLIYSGFAAALGLFFSAGARTTTRSLLATLFWLIMWIGGHWFFVGLVLLFTAASEMREITQFLLGLTPPLVLGLLTFNDASPGSDGFSFSEEYFHYAWIGLTINVLMTLLFLALARQRFYLNTGRIHNLEERRAPVPLIPPAQPPV